MGFLPSMNSSYLIGGEITVAGATFMDFQTKEKRRERSLILCVSNWCSVAGSNRRPSGCDPDALPAELTKLNYMDYYSTVHVERKIYFSNNPGAWGTIRGHIPLRGDGRRRNAPLRDGGRRRNALLRDGGDHSAPPDRRTASLRYTPSQPRRPVL